MNSIDTQRLKLAIRQWKEEVEAFEEYVNRLKGDIEAGNYDYEDLLVELEDDFEEAKDDLDGETGRVELELDNILRQLEEEGR